MKRIVAVLLVLIFSASLAPAFAAEPEIELYDYYAAETLPKIYIETENGVALNDPSLVDPDEKHGMMGELNVYNYVDATVSVRDCAGYSFEDAPASVKVRGNYTSTYPKYPIRIKFDKKQPMPSIRKARFCATARYCISPIPCTPLPAITPRIFATWRSM